MKTVFFDIDTQVDFMFPAGALYVPGAENVLPAIERLNRFAVENDIALVSTTDAHAENDAEFRRWPAHCVAGTIGQLKPQSTIVGTKAVVPAVETETLSLNAQQIVLEKVTTNCFDNPNLEAVLHALGGDRYVVYGVATDVCVRFAAIGLLRRGRRVEVVEDAVRHITEAGRRSMVDEFLAAGGVLTSVAEVCG